MTKEYRRAGVAFANALDAVLAEVVEVRPGPDGMYEVTMFEAICHKLAHMALTADDPRVALDAAKYVVDRRLGKPAQAVAVQARVEVDFMQEMAPEDQRKILELAMSEVGIAALPEAED